MKSKFTATMHVHPPASSLQAVHDELKAANLYPKDLAIERDRSTNEARYIFTIETEDEIMPETIDATRLAIEKVLDAGVYYGEPVSD